MRSGSPIQHSPPAASMSARRSSPRVTKRTAWPSALSARVSARPGRPPPTSRTLTSPALLLDLRAVLVGGDRRQALARAALVLDGEHLLEIQLGEVVVAALGDASALGPDARAQRVLRQLGLAAAAPPRVGPLEHLVEVVDLVLDLELRPAGRLPLQCLRARARVVEAEQQQRDHEDAHHRQDDRREGVHSGDGTRRYGAESWTSDSQTSRSSSAAPPGSSPTARSSRRPRRTPATTTSTPTSCARSPTRAISARSSQRSTAAQGSTTAPTASWWRRSAAATARCARSSACRRRWSARRS